MLLAARAPAVIQPRGTACSSPEQRQRPGSSTSRISSGRGIPGRQSSSGRHALAARAAAQDAVQGAAAADVSDDGAGWFSIDMSVRDYELDLYNVVNNAVYANYLTHCRHEYLAHVGLCADSVARSGNALAISELTMKYRLPLRSGDRFRAACRVTRATAARVVFEQQIVIVPRDGSPEQLALSAEAVVVSLDAQYRPKRIDAAVRQRLVAGAPAGGPLVPLQELL